jgi:phosphosulfolactate synthase
MSRSGKTTWGSLLSGLLIARSAKPRTCGITCVLDKHLGLHGIRDLIAVAGPYIDVLKLTSLTTAFYPESLLRKKIILLRDAGIEVCPGGTCAEVMIWQGVYREYLKRAKALGFTGIEISDGTIEIDDASRREALGLAAEMGFRVFSEVGRKEWSSQIGLEQLAADLKRDLGYGAEKVIIEAMEAGHSVGIMDEHGHPSEEGLKALLNAAGGPERVIFEAPLRQQQELFIASVGTNVNLGNIPPDEALVVEAARWGTTGIPFMRAYNKSREG